MSTTNTHLTTPEQADVLLVTATEVERQAVLSIFRKELQRTFVRRFDGNKTYFYLGEASEAHIFLVQSEMGSGGPSGSTLTVADSIRALHPSAIIMVGIAFGVDPRKQRIGQILVASQLRAYDLQRVGIGPDGQAIIHLRGDRPWASPRLVDRFNSGKADWKGASVRFGLLMSGDKLVDREDFRDQLRSLEPEALGGEMEGAGLYAVAQREKVDWILVKSICDYADGNKAQDKDKRQRTAARNAARFVFHVLRQGGFASGRVANRRSMQAASLSTRRSHRCDDLAANIGETLDLLKQYDDERRLIDDPKARLRAERNIADLRVLLDAYEQEQRDLGCA